ncbi:uncharacterized protein LOC122005747 isoform X2 [Zingiber officinale]|uniref:uncharacterized protein LOC122005747 isoform X2 n=1 Tax=Zingiber officinale TaxID=94328 RepID=UPI001C4D2274|nr:uncharacterized protein LOC122005747 isoform X2 [Zingiber officinale]
MQGRGRAQPSRQRHRAARSRARRDLSVRSWVSVSHQPQPCLARAYRATRLRGDKRLPSCLRAMRDLTRGHGQGIISLKGRSHGLTPCLRPCGEAAIMTSPQEVRQQREYTPENPKIEGNYSHHFYLSCTYEWRERSDTCPVCGKEMQFCESP